jgi:glutamyl-Q tRNA(Asp) synthetase
LPGARFVGKVWQDAVKFKCMHQPTTPGAGYRGRFAPSPTGDLHLGSLLAALGSWLFARRAGGHWLVRVEDLDPPREVPGAGDRQLATLRAFGMEPDGPVLRQSGRGERYRAALERLLESGQAFACHCSRSALSADGGIHRRCLAGAVRADPAIRFRVAAPCALQFDDAIHGRVCQDVAGEVGDFVLRRADGYWAYQLAVVVDDAEQRITEVVRGADLLDSTPRQILLQRALGLPTPAYAHLPLVLDHDGRKLSKSLAALPVDAADPLPALRAAWRLLGQEPRVVAAAGAPAALLRAALDGFDPARIPRTAVAPGRDAAVTASP